MSFSTLPIELKLAIMDGLHDTDLIALALTCKGLRESAQQTLFSTEIKINGRESDWNEERMPLQSMCSLLYALLTNPNIRGYVKSIKMIFGCYCRDEDEDEDKEQFKRQEELLYLAKVKNMWLDLPLADKADLRDVDYIFRRLLDGLSNALEPHVWFSRCMMLMLCFVPNLRSLVLCTREWGFMNPHGVLAEAELRPVTNFIVRRNKLPRLETLDLSTWAFGVELINYPHPFGALVTLTTLKDFAVEDILLCTLPRNLNSTREMTIIATEISSDSRGNHPGRVVTEFQTLDYMQHTPIVKRLNCYPRETLHTPFGNCVLTPLGWALKSLLLMRSLNPLVLGTTNLSSLVNLKDLSMDWHYITASAYDPRWNDFYRINLGQLLPLSLNILTITNDGRNGEPSWLYTITKDHRQAITRQLADVLRTRATTHYTAPLNICMDVFTAYRGFMWMFDLGGGYARCADWIDFITWRREMTASLARIDDDEAVRIRRDGELALEALEWTYEEWDLENVTTGWSWAPGVEGMPVWQDFWIG